jgi:hypothetical protein
MSLFDANNPGSGGPQAKTPRINLRQASKAVPVKRDPWKKTSPRDIPEMAHKATTSAIRDRVQHLSKEGCENERENVRNRIGDLVQRLDPHLDVEEVIARLTRALQDAEVTTNFDASRFFANENSSSSYEGMFERNHIEAGIGENARRVDVAKATPSGGVSNRVKFEEDRIIVPISPRRADMFANCVSRFGRTEGMHQFQPNSDLYIPNNRHFVGSTRPRYAALNYTGSSNGACAGDGVIYGFSVLVWKHDVKRRATFCPTDSFMGDVNDTTFCTYDNMEVMLAWLEDTVLKDLYDKVISNEMVFPRARYKYIECHIYDQLNFQTMLDHIRVSRYDLEEARIREEDFRPKIEKFCARNGTRWMWASK